MNQSNQQTVNLTEAVQKKNKLPPLLDAGLKKLDLRKNGYLWLCILIPIALMYLMYLSRMIHPFGDGSVLVLDLNAQYVWFFEALRDFVRGDASLLYSFARSMGGEFLGIYAYYIASPLSYLTCLFPKDRMLEALLFLFLLKTGLCGGTFGYYMHRTMKKPNAFAIVIFSTMYALSAYAVVQQHNTMWIDAVMWLPLLTLGIEALIKHGKFKLYTGMLALTLFSNFYIGYMVCIWCLFYFFYYYFAHNENNENNPLEEKRHFIKSLSRIAFYSVIAIGIAMVIILSAYYALNFGKTTFSDPKWEMQTNFDIIDLLYKFLPGSFDTVRPEGYPFVYCGLLTLLLLPAYFLSPKRSMRKKVLAGAFVFLFVASFTLSIPDLIWHGFQRPNWLNYRYSFMLCFFLCVLACRAFADFDTVSVKGVAVTAGLIALLCVILQKYTSGEFVNPDDYTCIWFTLIMLFSYLAILACLKTSVDQKQVVCVVLASAVCVEVFLNGLWCMNALDNDVVYSSYSSYNDFLDQTRPIVEQVQTSDTSFYRMERTGNRKINGNMALKIRGLSGSTSTLNKETIQILKKMGYSTDSHWSKYLGGTPVNDSLLGIKYIIADTPLLASYYQTYATDEENEYTAYYNPYALSLAYGVDEDVLAFRMGFTNVVTSTPSTGEDGEEKESKIASAVAAIKSKLNEWFDIDETINTSQYVDEYDSPFERLNAMITAMLGEKDTVEVFKAIPIESTKLTNVSRSYASGHYAYKASDPSKAATVSYNITMPKSTELFFYMPSDYPREAKLYLKVNDGTPTVQGDYFTGDTTCIVSMGQRRHGDTITLNLTLGDSNEFYAMMDCEAFYYIDWDLFENVMARLGKDQYQITEYTEDSFKGTFTASKSHELVMTTLAFDKGWKIYVDGAEVEPIKAFGAFVSFYVDGDAGQTHTIEMRYLPNTFVIGLTVSLFSLGLFLVLILLERRAKDKPFLRSLLAVPAPTEKAEGDDALPTDDDAAEPDADPPCETEEKE